MIAAFLLAHALTVQDSTQLPLAVAVERALATYPSVAAARALSDRAAADLGAARAGWLPRLSLDGSLNRFQEPMVVAPLHGFDPQRPPLFDRTLVQSGLSLNWTIVDFGRPARVRAQRALGRAADAALSATALALVARTVNTYLRVLTARDELAAQDQRLAALASELERAHQFFAQGKAARVDEIRVEAEATRARADRLASAAQLDVAERDLAQLTELPYATVHATRLRPLRLADTALAADTSGLAGRAALAQLAQQASPEVLELEQRERAARAGVAAARATWLPELRVGGAYIDRGRWTGDFAAEWQVGLALSYPLFTGGTRETAVRRAAAEDRAAAAHLRAGQLNVESGVNRALAALGEAQARVDALERAVDRTAEVARIERLSLDVGSGTQSDYLLAEANLLAARAGLIQARHAEISARVELARLTGELTPAWLERTLESQP